MPPRNRGQACAIFGAARTEVVGADQTGQIRPRSPRQARSKHWRRGGPGKGGGTTPRGLLADGSRIKGESFLDDDFLSEVRPAGDVTPTVTPCSPIGCSRGARAVAVLPRREGASPRPLGPSSIPHVPRRRSRAANSTASAAAPRSTATYLPHHQRPRPDPRSPCDKRSQRESGRRASVNLPVPDDEHQRRTDHHPHRSRHRTLARRRSRAS